MMSKNKKALTASELMQHLRSDPEWVRQNDERESRHKAAVAQLQTELAPEQVPLLADLANVGCAVVSVWDLVNTSASYAAAIPVLCKHLRRARHPVLREGIARALAVTDARGIAGTVLLQELMSQKDPSGSEERWALANALTVAADKTMVDEIKAMAADQRYADVRERLNTALRHLGAT